MRRLSQIGVVLIAVGVLVVVAPTGAFDGTTADRGIGVETAGDESDALLGLERDYDGTIIEYDSGDIFTGPTDVSADVAAVTNNLDEDWSEIDAEVTSVIWADGVDNRVLQVADSPDALDSGSQGQIELECSREVSGSADDAMVGIDITAGGDGSSVSVDRDSFTVTGIQFDCEGSDSPGFGPPDETVPIEDVDDLSVVGTPTASDSTGVPQEPDSRVQFDLQNSGSEQLTVTSIQMQDTTSSAYRVEYVATIIGGTDAEVEIGSDGELDVDDGLSIGEVTYDLDAVGTIGSGETVSSNIEQFRDGGFDSQSDMTGESVTVVLVVEGLDPNDPSEEVAVEIELENLE